jgi:uncharacterized membrane protein YjgN (DUF898 family)
MESGPTPPPPPDAELSAPAVTTPGESSVPTVEPPVLPPPLPPPPEPARFIFHGTVREYFRIWIVNTLLTLLTLGLFSAWAKVRKRRYLRGNTELLGHRFNYTADPRRILIGNLVVVVLFLAYALFGAVYPLLRVAALGLAVILLPWIIVRSLSFNAHHTMWRGLRFRFHPSLSAAVSIYLLRSLLIPLTLGFYYPAWARARTEFRISRHRLGTAYFHFRAENTQFYAAYLSSGAIVFVGLIVLGVFTNFITSQNGGHTPTTAQLLPAILIYGLCFAIAKHLAFAMLFNPTWNGTRLDEHRFAARLDTGRWLKLQLTNLGAIAISGGLLYPWAIIRSTRYALSCLEIHSTDALGKISRMGQGGGSALSDTAAEFAGLDFGL